MLFRSFRWEGEPRGESGRLTARPKFRPPEFGSPIRWSDIESNPKPFSAVGSGLFRWDPARLTTPSRSNQGARSRGCVQDPRPNAELPVQDAGDKRSSGSYRSDLRGRTSMHQFSVRFSRLPPLRCELRSDGPKPFCAIAPGLFQTSFWGPHDPCSPCRRCNPGLAVTAVRWIWTICDRRALCPRARPLC